MAKFNIEVELDWIENDEYSDFSIDSEIKHQVIEGIKSKLLEKSSTEIVNKFDEEIGKQLLEASKIIQEKVNGFLENICEENIANMKIPYKENSWGSKVEYIPMSQFVGMQYEAFLNKKVLDERGRHTDSNRERTTSINEYFLNNYLEKELSSKVTAMIGTAKEDAEKTVLNTLEQNLKDQLSVDTIKRLNIPKMLENLQQKVLDSEEKLKSMEEKQ